MAHGKGDHGHRHPDAVACPEGLGEEGAAVVRTRAGGYVRHWLQDGEVRSLDVPEERLLEALLEAVSAEFGPQPPGLAADLASDAPGLMPSAAVAKSFLTRLGRVEVERTCFHCRSCDKGSFPPDRAPDLEGSAFTPGMASVIAGTAQLMSFEAASRHVANLEGLDLVTSQVPVKCFCACHGSLTPGCPTSPHQFG
ncbi:MAG: hypothetical protein OXH79_02795 [Boseongicola sp.]|nr:hypothetical protein [Boseongicola sp.]